MTSIVDGYAESLRLLDATTGRRPSDVPAVSPFQYSVLVVDDEADMRDALGEALEDAGYRVFHAANGAEGLELLCDLAGPCAVILDLTMPVMNGIELYRIMKETPALADIPVVVSTTDPSRAPKGVPLMKKPVSLESLLTTVAALF